jgi:predicted transcriptional regulator
MNSTKTPIKEHPPESTMRKRAEWMKPTDDLILELLEEEGQYNPKIIAEKIGKHPKYVGERCRKLRDYNLLRNLGRGLYQITDLGEDYLAGDLDATELDDDSEKEAPA